MTRMERFDLSTQHDEGLAAAGAAITRGELVVVPTDTVYGIAADAFSPEAVQRLLDAKGRGRQMPPPVLVASRLTLDALAVGVRDWATALADALWPGALTLVFREQPSLRWDLGETRGTVAVRIPRHDDLLTLLERTGPLAVSSANKTGLPAAGSADDAARMLGEQVTVLLDGGRAPHPVASTIVDCTGEVPRILREGALTAAELDAVLAPFGLTVERSAGSPPEPEAPHGQSL